MRSEFLWQDGREVDRWEISTSRDPTESGFWLGDGLFETMLALNGQIFARDRHMSRFIASLKHLQLGDRDFNAGLDRALQWLDGRTGRIRLTRTSDDHIFVFAKEHELSAKPVVLTLFPTPVESNGILVGIKSLSYGVNALALRLARSEYAEDALFKNHRGEVTESALANLLAWDGSTWWTPVLTSGCLPGVTRELLVEYFRVEERAIKVEELHQMQGLALSSSLRGVQPVSQFQGTSYPVHGEVGRLRKDFANWREQNLNP